MSKNTHQRRWRNRLRASHDRFDIYLPIDLAEQLRAGLTGKLTASAFVARAVDAALNGTAITSAMQAPERCGGLDLSPETLAFARARAALHGVSVENFLLAAMRGVRGQTAVMIRGLAEVGRQDAMAALARAEQSRRSE